MLTAIKAPQAQKRMISGMTALAPDVQIVTLDVRDDIREGREPFGRIISAVSRLREGESLRLIAPFEPRPLFRVMAMQGWQHAAQKLDDGSWECQFFRDSAEGSSLTFQELDIRNAPPAEMESLILDQLAELPPRTALVIKSLQRPDGIMDFVEEIGWTMQICHGVEGCFVTQIMPP